MACVNAHINQIDRVRACVAPMDVITATINQIDRVRATVSEICTSGYYLRVYPIGMIWVNDYGPTIVAIESNTDWNIE